MAELVLNLDDSKVKDAVQQAILAQLGESARERIIGMAITHLVSAPKRDGYSSYNPPAPLEAAFQAAVTRVANEMVQDWVAKSPEVREAIDKKLQETAAKFISEDKDLARIVAETLAREVTVRKKDD